MLPPRKKERETKRERGTCVRGNIDGLHKGRSKNAATDRKGVGRDTVQGRPGLERKKGVA